MNGIRSFSYSVPARETPAFHETRNGIEDSAQPEKETANSFGTLLSGLSQTSANADVAADAPATLRTRLSKDQIENLTAGRDVPADVSSKGALEIGATSGGSRLAANLARSQPATQTGMTESSALTRGVAVKAQPPSGFAPALPASKISNPDHANAASPTLNLFAPFTRESDELASDGNLPSLNDKAAAAAGQAPAAASSRGLDLTQGPLKSETKASAPSGVSKPSAARIETATMTAPQAQPSVPQRAESGSFSLAAAIAAPAVTQPPTNSADTAATPRRVQQPNSSQTAKSGSVGKTRSPRGAEDVPQFSDGGVDTAAAVLAVVVAPSAVPDLRSATPSPTLSNDSPPAPIRTAATQTTGASSAFRGAGRSVKTIETDLALATPFAQQPSTGEQGVSGISFDMKVNVVSTATHFAPVARLSPIQQISNFVAMSLPVLTGAPAGAAPSAETSTGAPASVSFDPSLATAQPSVTALKTLNLQLEPENLGQVTITLNLSADGLDVEMQATRSSTVELIEKEKQSLSNQLQQSGYSVAGIEIKFGGATSPLSSGGFGGEGQADLAATPGGGQATGGSSSGNGSSHDSSPHAKNPQSSSGVSAHDGPPARRAGGDLYV